MEKFIYDKDAEHIVMYVKGSKMQFDRYNLPNAGPYEVIYKTDKVIVGRNDSNIRYFSVSGSKINFELSLYEFSKEATEIEIDGFRTKADVLELKHGRMLDIAELPIKINSKDVKIAIRKKDLKYDRMLIFEKAAHTFVSLLSIPDTKRYIIHGDAVFENPRIYELNNQEIYIEDYKAKAKRLIRFVRGAGIRKHGSGIIARTKSLLFLNSDEILELGVQSAQKIGMFVHSKIIELEIDGNSVPTSIINFEEGYKDKYKPTKCCGKPIRYLNKPELYDFTSLDETLYYGAAEKLVQDCDEIVYAGRILYFIYDGKPKYMLCRYSEIWEAQGNIDITNPEQILVENDRIYIFDVFKNDTRRVSKLPLSVLNRLPRWKRSR